MMTTQSLLSSHNDTGMINIDSRDRMYVSD